MGNAAAPVSNPTPNYEAVYKSVQNQLPNLDWFSVVERIDPKSGKVIEITNQLTIGAPHLPSDLFDDIGDKLQSVLFYGLETIPSNLFRKTPNLKYINFYDCPNLTTLPDTLFDNTILLKKVNIVRCAIQSLSATLFKYHQHLESVNIINTQLAKLSVGFLAATPALKEFGLCGCPVSKIPPSFFDNTPNIKKLCFNRTQITDIPHIPSSVTYLSLRYSQICRLPAGVITSKLTSFALDGNPITEVSDAAFGADNEFFPESFYHWVKTHVGCRRYKCQCIYCPYYYTKEEWATYAESLRRARQKDRCQSLKEELMAAAWHPDRPFTQWALEAEMRED